MKKASYKSSGVDIGRANAFVKAIQRDVSATSSASVIRRAGSFGSLFAFAKHRYKEPVLVSSTDGVGTKLLIAQSLSKHDTVGIDLVAMNVNDILCTGAKPLFFLDYIACGKLRTKVLKNVVRGIVAGCRKAGCSLIGGETAEMPGMYNSDEYDIAGFAVGVVEKKHLIDGSRIRAGDRVIGLPSSGLHSNGYSLVRKVLSKKLMKSHAKELLEPTRIYAKEVGALLKKYAPTGIAHITGGAYYDKLTKMLPKGKCIVLKKGSWPVSKIFQLIQKKGKINGREMYRTFNMGIGLAIAVRSKDLNGIKNLFKKMRVRCYEIGHVVNDRKRRIIL